VSSKEWHSFLIGLFEVLCPWPARYRITEESEFKPYKEHHYYLAGRWIGLRILVIEVLALIYLASRLLRLVL